MYEFKSLSIDDYELHYTNINGEKKIIPFKTTVEMATKLQSIEATARLNVMKQLTQAGMTKKDLIIERIENGKKVIDESNYVEFEENALNVARYTILNEIANMCFKMDFSDLIIDMGLDKPGKAKIAEAFGQKFALIISGKDNKNPSIRNQEQEKDNK